MRGRKPMPPQLKLATGNAGRRPVNLNGFLPLSAVPQCPPHLKGEARREWKRLSTELHLYKMLAKVDRGALAMACTCWSRYVEAEEMIEKASQKGGSGLFVKTPNGFPIQSPWLSVSNNAMLQYKGFCAEFGLTPAARVRLSPQTSQMELPGLELIQGGKPSLGDLIR